LAIKGLLVYLPPDQLDPALKAIKSAVIPAFEGPLGVGAVSPISVNTIPELISCTRHDADDWADPVIFGNFPTKERPVVIIPKTGEGERYDMLLMMYRESDVPLIMAIDFGQSEEHVGSEDEELAGGTGNVFDFETRFSHQMQNTTEYFLKCREDSGKNPIRGYKVIRETDEGGVRRETKCVYDFVHAFFVTKQLKGSDGNDVEFLRQHKVRKVWVAFV
jgi:hypothetical protein